MSRSSRAEIVIGLVIIAACIAVIVESLNLPPGSFEPLGSGPVPRVTASLIIVLSIWVIVAAFRRENGAETEEGREEKPLTAVFVALTFLYVLLLHTRLVDFGVLTAAFLFLAGWLMSRFDRRAVLPSLVIAAVIGFGTTYLFTEVFVVDLPVWR